MADGTVLIPESGFGSSQAYSCLICERQIMSANAAIGCLLLYIEIV